MKSIPRNGSLQRSANAALCLCALFLNGCLYSTQHFNSGRLLDPGTTDVTLGYGKVPEYSSRCAEEDGYYSYSRFSGAGDCIRIIYSGDPDHVPNGPAGNLPDTLHAKPKLQESSASKFSLGYRLGVRGAWGPFTGVEMGWHVEVPTNPASLEFDLKFGLPMPSHPAFHHSLSAGWIIGMWADNSYFLEYAASRAFGKAGEDALFGNYRVTWLATQPDQVNKAFSDFHFVSDRQWANQVSLGYFWSLPDIAVIPDFLVPEVTSTFPVAQASADVPGSILPGFEWNFSLGFGWRFK